MLAKTVIVLAIVMNFQPRRTLAEWKPVQAGLDDGGVGPRHYDQYEASAEDPEITEDAGEGEEVLRTMNLMDFADRKPTDMTDNSDYALASSSSSSVDEDSAADASSSLDLGGYMEGATDTQSTDNRWPAALSARPSRMKRDASNPHTSALQQLKPHRAVGGVGVGSSKALSGDMKDWPLLRSKRRARSQAELQRMVILNNLLNEFGHHHDDDDGQRRINGYGLLKRIPASYLGQAPPAKSRVAAGMRYAGIGKRKVNVRSRVDAGMRYMGIGKRYF